MNSQTLTINTATLNVSCSILQIPHKTDLQTYTSHSRTFPRFCAPEQPLKQSSPAKRYLAHNLELTDNYLKTEV